jgi:hypothetical protein
LSGDWKQKGLLYCPAADRGGAGDKQEELARKPAVMTNPAPIITIYALQSKTPTIDFPASTPQPHEKYHMAHIEYPD